MRVRRLAHIPGFSIDEVASAAGSDPDVLRLENLDTDLRPPAAAIAATRAALESDDANSYLPFTGTLELRRAVAERLRKQTNHNWPVEDIVITAGGTEATLDVLLATTDPGDEIILTDPCYAGTLNRVRLVGAVPKLVPLLVERGEWRLDVDALVKAINKKTRALLLMSPSMPSGAVFNRAEWSAIADICRHRSLALIYIAAMEHILYDGREYIHPASLPGMKEFTITIGSVSKEQRMIGWRIGWVVAPHEIAPSIAKAHIYNVVTSPGITQAGAAAALHAPASDLADCVAEWQRRRDTVLEQLRNYTVIKPGGGWSLLMDVSKLGHDCDSASKLMLKRGKIAATPMKNWGEKNADQYVRLVFSNEPVKRLRELGPRMKKVFK